MPAAPALGSPWVLAACAFAAPLCALPFTGAGGALALLVAAGVGGGVVYALATRLAARAAALDAHLAALGQGETPPPPTQAPGLAALHAALGDLRARPSVKAHEELLGELGTLATELDAGTRQVLFALRFLHESANDQASAVEETRRTMGELLRAAEQIAQTADAVHGNAQQTETHNAEIAAKAEELDSLTREIGEALLGISALADRSDILALNAALQGSRAGEAGRGFVLVAEEMRRLAESVVAFVVQIQDLVKRVEAARETTAQATLAGVSLAGETRNSAERIRLTSRQQKGGTEAVTQSMDAVTELITHSKAGAEECARALEELGRRASELNARLQAKASA